MKVVNYMIIINILLLGVGDPAGAVQKQVGEEAGG